MPNLNNFLIVKCIMTLALIEDTHIVIINPICWEFKGYTYLNKIKFHSMVFLL